MACEVRNKEINSSQCAELLVRPLYIKNITGYFVTMCKISKIYSTVVKVLRCVHSNSIAIAELSP